MLLSCFVTLSWACRCSESAIPEVKSGLQKMTPGADLGHISVGIFLPILHILTFFEGCNCSYKSKLL